MRKGYSLLLLLICFLGTFAQNWAPINTTDKYNYKLDTASAISHTLWVDSVQVVGGDTVYFMNRVVKKISIDTTYNQQTVGKALLNQPQFLLKQVVKKVAGMYDFNSPGNIEFNSMAALGDSMIFDSIANVSSRVIAVDTAKILGALDSVKTFLLSSGDTIVLSKSFGFIQYPSGYGMNLYFRLVGVEGSRNIGRHVVGVKDFFDFQIGDIFEYYQYHQSPLGDGNGMGKAKIKIVNKQMFGDSLYRYALKIDFTNYVYTMSGLIDTITDTSSRVLDVSNKPNSELNLYPNQLISTNYIDGVNSGSIYDFVDFFRWPSQVLLPSYDGCRIGNYSPQQYFSSSDYFDNGISPSSKVFDTYYGQDSLIDHGDTLTYWKSRSVGLDANIRTFIAGRGLFSYYSSSCFEHNGKGYLLAYRTSTDSMGVLDTFIRTGIENIDTKSLAFTIQPNPITNFLNIQLPEATNSTIRLLDLNGSEVLVQQSNDGHISINTSSLPAGLYIVEVRTKAGVGRKKVIKM